MGDLSYLAQIAKDEFAGDESVEQASKNMLSGKFTLVDMYQQMAAVTKMGPLQKVMSMLPGMSSMEDKIDYDESQKRLAQFRVIMDSMTLQEKEQPAIIKGKRIDRIAAGSGVEPKDVRLLLKQYNQSRKMMGTIGKDRKMRKKLMKQFGDMDADMGQ
jgi:signal recognition particle subunit SRP54